MIVRGGERVAAGAFAITGGHRVAATQHFLGKVGIVVAETLLIGAVLAEDFDATHEVSRHDDVAVWVNGASDIGGGAFWFGCVAKVGCCRSGWHADVQARTIICCRFGRRPRIRSADQSYRGRVTEVVQRVAGSA